MADDPTSRSGSRSTKTRAARSSISSAATASCGNWATARSASSMSSTAICATTTSPSSSSTTTSPPPRVRCRACRGGRDRHHRPGAGGRAMAGRSARATCSNIVLANYRQPGRAGVSRCPRPTCPDWELVLEKIRKRANSTAVERFNRESRVSGIIRADQLSRSNQAQVSGTVDIIGSTQRFQIVSGLSSTEERVRRRWACPSPTTRWSWTSTSSA